MTSRFPSLTARSSGKFFLVLSAMGLDEQPLYHRARGWKGEPAAVCCLSRPLRSLALGSKKVGRLLRMDKRVVGTARTSESGFCERLGVGGRAERGGSARHTP